MHLRKSRYSLFIIFLLVPCVSVAKTYTSTLTDGMIIVNPESQAENVIYDMLQSDIRYPVHEGIQYKKSEVYSDKILSLSAEQLGECSSYYGVFGSDRTPNLEFGVIYDKATGKTFIVTDFGGGCPSKINGHKHIYKLRSLQIHRYSILTYDEDTNSVEMTDGGEFE